MKVLQLELILLLQKQRRILLKNIMVEIEEVDFEERAQLGLKTKVIKYKSGILNSLGAAAEHAQFIFSCE